MITLWRSAGSFRVGSNRAGSIPWISRVGSTDDTLRRKTHVRIRKITGRKASRCFPSCAVLCRSVDDSSGSHPLKVCPRQPDSLLPPVPGWTWSPADCGHPTGIGDDDGVPVFLHQGRCPQRKMRMAQPGQNTQNLLRPCSDEHGGGHCLCRRFWLPPALQDPSWPCH